VFEILLLAVLLADTDVRTPSAPLERPSAQAAAGVYPAGGVFCKRDYIQDTDEGGATKALPFLPFTPDEPYLIGNNIR